MNYQDEMNRSRDAMVQYRPFWGVQAQALQLVERCDIATASTDGVRLFYNPAFIESLTNGQRITLWAHEIEHVNRGHLWRLEWRDLELANIAADHEINLSLVAQNFEPLDDWLCDSRFADLAFEEIYHALESEQNQQPQPQDSDDTDSGNESDNGESDNGQSKQDSSDPGDDSSDPGDSSDTGQDTDESAQPGESGQSMPDPGKSGGFIEPAKTDSNGDPVDVETLRQKWETTTRQAARIAAKESGTMPGYAQNVLDSLDYSSIDWRVVLSDFISDKIQQDYSFRRPNRRYLNSGFVMPSLVADGIGELVFFVDTSGSMDSNAFEAILGELNALLDSGFVSAIHVVQGDTRMTNAATYETGDTIPPEIYGGGGTDFRECMAYIAETHADCAAMVCFTDLMVDADRIGNDPELPTLWVCWASAIYARYMATPAFGEIVPLMD